LRRTCQSACPLSVCIPFSSSSSFFPLDSSSSGTIRLGVSLKQQSWHCRDRT
uniref:Ovule protein n=1 Tax=Haemonchus placei TaxID=6290 RepID=A0A0N4W1H5_HAEPC